MSYISKKWKKLWEDLINDHRKGAIPAREQKLISHQVKERSNNQ